MPGYWEAVRKGWEADHTERYNDAEIRILRSQKRRVEAQHDLLETTARLQGQVQAAMYRAQANVYDAEVGMLDAQARVMVKRMEIEQIRRGVLPARLQPPNTAPALPAATRPAIEPYREDREVESLAQRIAHKIASHSSWEREAVWEDVRAGLCQDLEPFAAREVERRAAEILELIGE